jgi:GTP:adenosylcobinamide-phosphate guanylyltransferase
MNPAVDAVEPLFSVVVLAGERPGGSALSRQLDLPAGVLVDVAGQPALQRVIDALGRSRETGGGVLCGPAEAVYRQHPQFDAILAGSGIEWAPPRAGPSESAEWAARKLNRFPLLLTTGDHALLTPGLVDDFCSRARRQDADAVVGLVPHARVSAVFPQSRRTVHRFRDGGYCGANLFALLNGNGMAGPRFWRQVEADRKKPWRIARRIGVAALLRYLLRRLTLEQALDALSEKMGCRIACVRIEDPRAAIDVDSVADRDLANAILGADAKTG